jgi:hypothetical protein
VTDQIPADAITAGENAWQAWYEPADWTREALSESPHNLAHRAFLAAWEASAAQAAAAERERIRQLAIRVEAQYSDGDDGEICCDDDCHLIWKPFAELLDAP